MTRADLSEFQLEPYREQIAKVVRPCLLGTLANEPTGDFFGGMPMVDDPFVWPQKDGYPLNFVGQVQCCRFKSLPMQEGYLLFFYDNRHWGYAPLRLGKLPTLSKCFHVGALIVFIACLSLSGSWARYQASIAS